MSDKEINEIITDTAIDKLKERISELEASLKVERKAKIWDAKLINKMNKQFAELRNSYVEIEAYSEANSIHITELREKFDQKSLVSSDYACGEPKEDSEKKKRTGTDYKNPYIILQKEAFDDSDEFPFEVEQCYKCLNLHNKCNDCDDFEHYKEASGGENSVGGVEIPDKKSSVVAGSVPVTDSKPPEPYDFAKTTKKTVDRLLKQFYKDYICVKREDLERLFFVLDWELNMDILTHKDYKYINKFKEEYNL